jgi:energy-coupling factor transport system substrate-specific component
VSKKILSVRTVVAIGIGSAIAFVLMRFVAIPSGVPNTNLNLGLASIASFAAVFGPVAGFLIGFISHTITDLTWGGVWWSWVIADAVFGFLVGLFATRYQVEDGNFSIKECIAYNVCQIVSNLLAWAVVAPGLDILIYAEPANKVFVQGLVAAGLNSAVCLILGSLILFGYSKTRIKAGSLSKG